jgi:predicted metal-dependent peptidase
MPSTTTDLLQRLLARLILRHPFLATLALRLERVEDPTCETAWTDGVRLGVNPAYLEALGDEERLTLLAHECYHVALGHHLRRRGRDERRWNRACDYAVNALLLADGFRLVPRTLYDPAYGDASAEAIYNQLPEPAPDSNASTPPPAGGGTGAGAGGNPAPAPAGAAPQTPAGATSPSQAGATPPPPAGTATPSSSTPASSSASAEPGPIGEIRDLPLPAPPTEAQQEELLARHAILVTALAQQARAVGKGSAGADRAAKAALEPASIDWRTLLVEFLTSRNCQDYTWSRPNLRYVFHGFYLPALHASAPGRIAFVIDTSGSVPAAALAAITAELEAYLYEYPGTTVEVLYADSAVKGRVSLTAADLPLELKLVGGGGTAFAPALAELEGDEEPPACVVYLTDLCGSFPQEPPEMPVLWLVFGQPLETPVPPFGKVVVLPF